MFLMDYKEASPGSQTESHILNQPVSALPPRALNCIPLSSVSASGHKVLYGLHPWSRSPPCSYVHTLQVVTDHIGSGGHGPTTTLGPLRSQNFGALAFLDSIPFLWLFLLSHGSLPWDLVSGPRPCLTTPRPLAPGPGLSHFGLFSP